MAERERKIENEISPELVEKIENSKLDVESKVNLILVKAEAKPSSILDITIRTGENIWLDPKDLNEVESILKEAGLAFDVGEVLTEGSEEDEEKKDRNKTLDTVEILISTSEVALKQLKEVKKRLPGPQQIQRGEYTDEQRRADYMALGLTLGYPESAVVAFSSGETIKEGELPEGVKESEAYIFSTFVLSRNNWQEELKQGQAWADCIKSLSPKTYNNMMERAKALQLK